MNGLYRVYYSDPFNTEFSQGEMIAVNATGFDHAAEKVRAGIKYEIHVFRVDFVEQRQLEVVK